MSVDMTDREQIEMIKKWWQENGKFTLISISAAIILSFGWRYWQSAKAEEAAKSSVLYEQLVGNENSHNYGQVEMDVTSMLTIHPKSPYAALAAFTSAQNAVNKKDFESALQKLNWVIDNSKNKDFKQIAKLRKSRILLEEKKYDEALKVLDPIDADAYTPAINELKGDIYSAKGDYSQARAAYQNALNNLKKDAANRSFLQMKYHQLPGS